MSFSPEDYTKQKNDLETQKAEAEASLDGEKVGELEKALADLESKKKEFESMSEKAGDPTETQVKQVEDLGGSKEELNEKIEEGAKNQQAEVEEIKKKIEDPKPSAGLENSEQKKGVMFDALIEKKSQQKARFEEWGQEVFSKFPTAEDALKAYPTSMEAATYALEKNLISPERMVSFILENSEVSDKMAAVNKFVGQSSPDQVKEIQKSKDPVVKEAIYFPVQQNLSQLESLVGPHKRHIPELVTNFLKFDQVAIDSNDMPKINDPMSKVRSSLRDYAALVAENPKLKGAAIDQASTEDLKLLGRIKGLGLEKADVLSYLKDKIKEKDGKSFEKAVDLHMQGFLTRDELDSLAE